LVELLAVIAVIAILVSVISTVLHAVIRADRSLKDQKTFNAAVIRLSEQFREDVHLAEDVKLTGAEDVKLTGAEETETETNNRLLLTLPQGRTVTYEIQPGRVVRRLTRAGETEHQEAYRLPPETTGRFEPPGEANGRLAALVLVERAAEEPENDDAARSVRIEAAVGLDRSFVDQEP